MSRTNLSITQDIYAAFAQGDIPAVLGRLDDHVDWRAADNFIYADGSPYIGPDAILKGVFMRFGAEWSSFSIAIEEFLDAGETVAVQGRYQGSYLKTGRSLDAQFLHIWKFKDGKAVEFQQYTDTFQFLQVTGE